MTTIYDNHQPTGVERSHLFPSPNWRRKSTGEVTQLIIAEACDVFEADALWNTAGKAKLDWTEICVYIYIIKYLYYVNNL